jgi:hypothetical protein
MAAKKAANDPLAELAKGNPKVDLTKLKAAVDTLKELRESGLPQSASSVTSPYGQPSIRLGKEPGDEILS